MYCHSFNHLRNELVGGNIKIHVCMLYFVSFLTLGCCRKLEILFCPYQGRIYVTLSIL